MTVTSIPDSRLGVTDLGAGGPVLLLLAGSHDDRVALDRLARPASEHRRVVVVDLPDVGPAPDPQRLFADAVVTALVDTMAALGLTRVVPVTLSRAGWAAAELRRRLGPRVVPGVVLTDPRAAVTDIESFVRGLS